MSGGGDEQEDGTAEPREPATSAYDDLSRRTLPQLRDLHRGRLQRVWLAIGLLLAGVLLACLPTGAALAYPATLLVTGGILAVPVTAVLLHHVHREVVARELREARGGDGAGS